MKVAVRYYAEMSRNSVPSEYVLRVNLKDASDVRRFCEVRVQGKDVYIYQPRKGGPVKVAEGEVGAQDHAGISAHQEALLGSAHVGTRVLLL